MKNIEKLIGELREKVKANEQITKLQKEKKRLESVKEMYVMHKHVYQKQWLDELESNREKDKIINLMAEFIEKVTVDMKIAFGENMLWDRNEIKQHFENLAKETK